MGWYSDGGLSKQISQGNCLSKNLNSDPYFFDIRIKGTVLIQLLESFTTSKMDRHLLRQKPRQGISVKKTNTGVFVVFKTKHELKCQFSAQLLRFFEKLFDVINDNPFLTL